MSDAVIIRALLIADAAVAATVPPAKVYFAEIPQGTELPAIAVASISTTEPQSRLQDVGDKVFKVSRVQVTVAAKSYLEQGRIIALVGAAIRGGRRHVAGILVANIERAGTGPDDGDSDAKIFQQTRDFRVSYFDTP
jgi:hypothetical protein